MIRGIVGAFRGLFVVTPVLIGSIMSSFARWKISREARKAER